ncbi:MAG: hypothetical protein IJR26_05615 [Bacteroidales bacterium]|nr:hypothetical protein [Bacteroidales bacterium]
MSTISIAIIIVLTALLSVAVTGFLFYKIVKSYLDNQQKMQMLQMKIDEHKESLKTVTPIRLQAYERMALYLERISPNSLILRTFRPGMDIKALQVAMTKNIRDEWEHNLSQQVYLSTESWNRIREAKEEMINLINASAVKLAADADPSSLAGAIFESVAKSKIPTDEAIEFMKSEIQERFA